MRCHIAVLLATFLDDESCGVCAVAELEDQVVEEPGLRWRDADLEP